MHRQGPHRGGSATLIFRDSCPSPPEGYAGLLVVKAGAAPRWPAASPDNSHARRDLAFTRNRAEGGQAVQIGLFWISEPTMTDPSSERAKRVLQARMAAHALHARVGDPSAHTAPARKVFLSRFEREVDPEGVLDPQERARRAEHAKKAYFIRLAAASSKSRSKKRQN